MGRPFAPESGLALPLSISWWENVETAPGPTRLTVTESKLRKEGRGGLHPLDHASSPCGAQISHSQSLKFFIHDRSGASYCFGAHD
eukprot:3769509-Rhodomonas_salina.1